MLGVADVEEGVGGGESQEGGRGRAWSRTSASSSWRCGASWTCSPPTRTNEAKDNVRFLDNLRSVIEPLYSHSPRSAVCDLMQSLMSSA